jgi:uncharacterized protein YutE (UPF0331/DUF86 family)
VDRELVVAKLEALRRWVERVRERTPGSVEELADDEDMQDIISVNLERAVQVCTDIASHIVADSNEEPPISMGTAFDSLACLEVISRDLADRMKRAVGFRNISVHTYDQIDWAIVFDICGNRLGDFAEFARSVEARLPE